MLKIPKIVKKNINNIAFLLLLFLAFILYIYINKYTLKESFYVDENDDLLSKELKDCYKTNCKKCDSETKCEICDPETIENEDDKNCCKACKDNCISICETKNCLPQYNDCVINYNKCLSNCKSNSANYDYSKCKDNCYNQDNDNLPCVEAKKCINY